MTTDHEKFKGFECHENGLTVSESLTQKQWEAAGAAMGIVPGRSSPRVVCQFCNRVESNSYHHKVRCRGYWTLTQERLKNDSRAKVYRCRCCGCKVYSRRREVIQRSCWDCLKVNKAESLRKHRQKYQSAKEPIQCLQCGVSFVPKRSTAKFCGTACRVAAKRIRDCNGKLQCYAGGRTQDSVTSDCDCNGKAKCPGDGKTQDSVTRQ